MWREHVTRGRPANAPLLTRPAGTSVVQLRSPPRADRTRLVLLSGPLGCRRRSSVDPRRRACGRRANNGLPDRCRRCVRPDARPTAAGCSARAARRAPRPTGGSRSSGQPRFCGRRPIDVVLHGNPVGSSVRCTMGNQCLITYAGRSLEKLHWRQGRGSSGVRALVGPRQSVAAWRLGKHPAGTASRLGPGPVRDVACGHGFSAAKIESTRSCRDRPGGWHRSTGPGTGTGADLALKTCPRGSAMRACASGSCAKRARGPLQHPTSSPCSSSGR